MFSPILQPHFSDPSQKHVGERCVVVVYIDAVEYERIDMSYSEGDMMRKRKEENGVECNVAPS